MNKEIIDREVTLIKHTYFGIMANRYEREMLKSERGKQAYHLYHKIIDQLVPMLASLKPTDHVWSHDYKAKYIVYVKRNGVLIKSLSFNTWIN